MKTGLIDSIQECRAKGLPVVEYDVHPFNPNAKYVLTISIPEAWNENGRRKSGCEKPYAFYDRRSYRDLEKLWGEKTPDPTGFKDYITLARKLQLIGKL